MTTVPLAEAVLLPEPGDNAGVATRVLEPGTVLLADDGTEVPLAHTVLEGHRVVVRPTAAGEALTSWGTPFAVATRDLVPGEYVSTAVTLAALRDRDVPGLPDEPSARNVPMDPHVLDEDDLVAHHLGDQVRVDDGRTFLGYPRPQGPAGTRNHLVLLAATSRSSSFVLELARTYAGREGETFDGVVPVAHTEGGEPGTPNNVAMVLNVLAGMQRHPNVGAVLLV